MAKKKRPKPGARAPKADKRKAKPKRRVSKSYALKAPGRASPPESEQRPTPPAAPTRPPDPAPSPAASTSAGAPAMPPAAAVLPEPPPSQPASASPEPQPAAAPSSPLLSAPQPETLHSWLGEAERRLTEAGLESARLDSQILVAAVLDADPGTLRFAEDRAIDTRDAQRIENFLRRRVKTREPVSRILGCREFWSLEFRVTPAVLDPRPDSETLVEAALSLFPDGDAPLSVLDLGTGSGCLVLAVLHERPNAIGLGVDVSEQALEVAAGNAERLGLAARVEFRKSDWSAEVPECFQLILCNPPYIAEADRASLAPEVARHDPRGALFAGPDGLDAYRAILPDVPRLLAEGGVALFEIGAAQAEAVSGIARGAGLDVLDVGRDLAGRDRCVLLVGRVRNPLIPEPA